jgi:hypothetical protein
MVIGQKVYCDYCNELCLPDDFTSVHIEGSGGELHEFTFHNRNSDDCLAKSSKSSARSSPRNTSGAFLACE